ncbi:hypothetical protein HID58_082053 [Brassica napus]|uniref:Uncharacterized protein n=1 Tax=Brassica napus TaxID=3708 RepID=A0ABQ7Y9K1_BRANA|nr:hypothetical protein HID58_082053 [Brassica napus]
MSSSATNFAQSAILRGSLTWSDFSASRICVMGKIISYQSECFFDVLLTSMLIILAFLKLSLYEEKNQHSITTMGLLEEA